MGIPKGSEFYFFLQNSLMSSWTHDLSGPISASANDYNTGPAPKASGGWRETVDTMLPTQLTQSRCPPGHSLQLLPERMASRDQKSAQRNQVQGLPSSPPLGLELCKDRALRCNLCLVLQPRMCRTPKAPYSAGAKIRINSQHLKYKVKGQRRNGNREEQMAFIHLYPY